MEIEQSLTESMNDVVEIEQSTIESMRAAVSNRLFYLHVR